MGLFEKFKNIFTEEIEEEVPIKKEVVQVEIPAPKLEEEAIVRRTPPTPPAPEPPKESKSEKFVFPVYFDDKDFDTITPKKEEPPKKKEVPKKEIYGGNSPSKPKEKPEKKFVPSPVISPVYGILDKNYRKEEIIAHTNTNKSEYYKSSTELTLDAVRKKAFGTLEDELETSLFKDDPIYMEKDIEEQKEIVEPVQEALPSRQETRQERYVEEKELDSTDSKEELLEDLKEEDSAIHVVEDSIIDEFVSEKKDTDIEDNMTLDALNHLSEDEEELNLTESDIFNLIDSMYDKGDEEDGNTF